MYTDYFVDLDANINADKAETEAMELKAYAAKERCEKTIKYLNDTKEKAVKRCADNADVYLNKVDNANKWIFKRILTYQKLFLNLKANEFKLKMNEEMLALYRDCLNFLGKSKKNYESIIEKLNKFKEEIINKNKQNGYVDLCNKLDSDLVGQDSYALCEDVEEKIKTTEDHVNKNSYSKLKRYLLLDSKYANELDKTEKMLESLPKKISVTERKIGNYNSELSRSNNRIEEIKQWIDKDNDNIANIKGAIDDYLNKPFDFTSYNNRLESLRKEGEKAYNRGKIARENMDRAERNLAIYKQKERAFRKELQSLRGKYVSDGKYKYLTDNQEYYSNKIYEETAFLEKQKSILSSSTDWADKATNEVKILEIDRNNKKRIFMEHHRMLREEMNRAEKYVDKIVKELYHAN